MFTELLTQMETAVAVQDAILPLAFSLLAAVAAFFMYQAFYGSNHIGAGVHRTFIIGGPAMTTIFLVIQTSIPLGMGLLGTLSFVRFRTPVKDPAEVGFLLLLIAAAIGAATGNYLAIILLFALTLATLGIQRFANRHLPQAGKGQLMISVDETAFPALAKSLSAFLNQRLPGLSLQTVSTIDHRVGIHYQYRKRSQVDWADFTSELDKLAGPGKIDIFAS